MILEGVWHSQGMVIGYARVSTYGKNLDVQVDVLAAAGAAHIFQKKITGKNRGRPGLQRPRASTYAGILGFNADSV